MTWAFSRDQYTALAVGAFAKSVKSTFVFDSQRFELTTHMLLRRHPDAGSAVYIWIASTRLPNTGVQFVEQALISARDTAPSSASAVKRPALFQYWYRIHAEEESAVAHERTAPLPLGDLGLLKESAMRLRSHLSLDYLKSLEYSLMSGTSISSAVPSCDAHMLP